MGSAASTAYQLGRETASSPSVGAGLGGIARAAGNAARSRASGTLGLGDAAAEGRQAAWNAVNRQNSPPPAPPGTGERQSVVEGKRVSLRVDLGVRRNSKKKKTI